MTKQLPHLDQLFDRFYVDSTSPSGLRYTRNVGTRIKKDQVVGSLSSKGYWKVVWDGRCYLCHRIVQKLKTGQDFTDLTVDHKDRNKENNHPFNLRWATVPEQLVNRKLSSKIGLTGVCVSGSKKNPYKACARDSEGRKRHLGVYPTAQLAHQAYLDFQSSLF